MNREERRGVQMRTVEHFCKDYYVERRQTDSMKWDGLKERFGDAELLPLWVADMDFKVPREVQDVLMKRIEHGVFGYSIPSDTYYAAFINWQKERHGTHVAEEWIRFSTGVVNSFNYMIQAFTKEQDSVMILSPVYYPFYDAVKNNQRKLIVSELQSTKTTYEIDFKEIEEKIISHKVKMLIHCSPHNPVGRVWSEKELAQLMAICFNHDVMVISDEIHQDFIKPGFTFTSMLSLEQRCHTHLVVLTSASKSFNIASLLQSHIIIPDLNNRETYDKFAQKMVNNPPSLMGMIATEACYIHGGNWLNELSNVIEHNDHLLRHLFKTELPDTLYYEKQGTYLAWLDLKAYITPKEMKEIVQDKAKLAIDYGEWFGESNGTCIRINLATKPEIVEQAGKRLINAILSKK